VLKDSIVVAVAWLLVAFSNFSYAEESVWTNATAIKTVAKAQLEIRRLQKDHSSAAALEMANWVFAWNSIYTDYKAGKISQVVPKPSIGTKELVELVERAAVSSWHESRGSNGIAYEAGDFLGALFSEGVLVAPRKDVSNCWDEFSQVPAEESTKLINQIEKCIQVRQKAAK
jgi:hypothetical protein